MEAVIVQTGVADSGEAGRVLGRQLLERMSASPDALVVFASPHYEQGQLLRALKEQCQPACMIGCSSAGEFTNLIQGEGLVCAMAFYSSEMSFKASIGRQLSANPLEAARELHEGFSRDETQLYPFQAALVLTDALAGHVEALVEHLTHLTLGKYQFVGGGAGDNAQFCYTPVFYETEVVEDAVVALEIRTRKPLGIGAYHCWGPVSQAMYVTKAEGPNVLSLDGIPALEVFREHARLTQQNFEPTQPLPFFLQNIIGIRGAGYKLRVPLAINSDGSVYCAAEVPEGLQVCIMGPIVTSPAVAAQRATHAALQNLYGSQPQVAIFFDCVATRLRIGQEEFRTELAAMQAELQAAPYIGCNSHGQIARLEGQYAAFHNCTAVVCVFPA